MLRATSVKAAAGSGLLRGPASSVSRRSIYCTSTVQSACSSSNSRSDLNLTARRPLAVVDRAFNGRRGYAAPAEERGVVSLYKVLWIEKGKNFG